ncbi:MAG: sialidase family protein, partial [Bryobacterales bacterium]
MSLRSRFLFSLFIASASLSAQVTAGQAGVESFRIRFGVGATAEQKWDGAVTVSAGELVEVRNWHPRPEDEMIGRNEWRLSTHKMLNYTWRPVESPPNTGTREYFWPRGVVVDVKAQPGTRVNVRTEQGRFAFNVGEIALLEEKAFLNGRVLVDRVPTVGALTGAEYEDDYAAMLSGAGGEVWTAWVAFKDGANFVMARRFDGSSWGPVQQVTEQPGDVFLVKLGRDIKGRPWAIWSNQIDGNFDLYARPFNGRDWGPVERLTDAPGPDVFPATVTDSAGNLWLAWQGYRNGQSDIFVRRFDGDSWSEPFLASDSTANDWEPTLAADSKGRVTVGWDTYDTGDYNIRMRSYERGEWKEPAPVADTKLYEANVSLLYDKQDRLWAVWNESGMNWGKDTGWLLNLEGTRLYESRNIGLAVHDGSGWKQPAGDINEQLPKEYSERFDDFPKLSLDSEGRVWVFARQRLQRRRDTPGDTPNHRA